MIAYRTNLVVIVPKAFRTFHDQCPVHIRVLAVFTGTFGVKGGGRFRVTTTTTSFQLPFMYMVITEPAVPSSELLGY